MNSELTDTGAGGLAVGDIYYTLFRHKGKIILCSCIGLTLALILYWRVPRLYQSEAKLFVRYVTDAKSLAPAGGVTNAKSPDQRGETIMESEIEIITSLDLARRVAEALGSEAILGPRPSGSTGISEIDQAATAIRKGLMVDAPPQSTVIRVIFSHSNPALVQPALTELIRSYLQLHGKIHRAVGIAGDFLARETDVFRARLAQTEDALRETRNSLGISSLINSANTNAGLIATVREQIFAAQAELAERSSIAQEEQKRGSALQQAGTTTDTVTSVVPPEQANAYKSLLTRTGLLRRMEQELLLQFRGEHSRVKDIRGELTIAEAAKLELEERYPGIDRTDMRQGLALQARDTHQNEAARVIGLQAKIEVLKARLDELRAEDEMINEAEPKITELQRRKELEEANYRHFSTTLEQTRIDEALANSQVTNISQIQFPSPPLAKQRGIAKYIIVLGVGGLIVGIGWSFLIELYLDRTIKRRTDVERILNPSLFLSIPNLWRNPRRRLLKSSGRLGSAVRTGNGRPALRPFHDALRDRLIDCFESKGLTHKPKLVAVTSPGLHAGVSTTAAGLARSLSEIGEGNVLLVDLTTGQESAGHFVHGEIVCDLNQVLDAPAPAQVAENLYVVSERNNEDPWSTKLPLRFSKLAEKLKASAFEYIIFDLPLINPISITSRIAPYMDFVIMVVQSEKTESGVLERAANLLTRANAPVGIVLNRTRPYVPSWLQQEFVGET